MSQDNFQRGENFRAGGCLLAIASGVVAIGLLVKAVAEYCWYGCDPGVSNFYSTLALVIGTVGSGAGIFLRVHGNDLRAQAEPKPKKRKAATKAGE